MDTKDILLSAALDSNVLSSSESFIDECYAHNIDFARTYDKNIYYGQTTSFKRLAVICCMVARLYVFRMLGLKPGEAHIILNGGGRIRDAIHSLIYSQIVFQTKEVMIIHHTDCGFTYFSNNDQILASLTVQTGTNKNNPLPCRPLYENNDKLDFMPILDIEQSVHDDVAEYKQYPMLNQNNIVRGFIYDIKTGLLKEIK